MISETRETVGVRLYPLLEENPNRYPNVSSDVTESSGVLRDVNSNVKRTFARLRSLTSFFPSYDAHEESDTSRDEIIEPVKPDRSPDLSVDFLRRYCNDQGSLRHASTSARDSTRHVRPRRRSSNKSLDAGNENRSITVEIITAKTSTNKSTTFERCPDSPDHDYSSCLTMTSLANGRFTAELSLRDVPPGDLTLRAENHRILLIITGKRGDSRHRVVQSYVCGYLQLPIYVDPFTLQLGEVSGQLLFINCQMKGYVDKQAGEVVKPATRVRRAVVRSLSSPSLNLLRQKLKRTRRISNLNSSGFESISE